MNRIFAATILCALLFAGCAHHAPLPEFVSIASPAGVRRASVQPMSTPYTQGGPTATAWLPNGDAHLADGRVVTGMMIRAWSESGSARVQVYAMATRVGAPARFTTDEAELEPIEVGSYLLRPNQGVMIAEMKKFGAEPLMLRY